MTQLTRVKIDIGVNQDEDWKIDVKKVSAQMPETVRARIKTLLSTINAPSRKVYRRRATRLTSPDSYPTWNVERKDDKNLYRINRSHPVIETLRQTLDEDDAKSLETILSLIESSFPTERLFYDFSNNEEGVAFAAIDDDNFNEIARTFFASLRTGSQSDESILNIMRYAEPFMSRWDDTLAALGLEEQS